MKQLLIIIAAVVLVGAVLKSISSKAPEISIHKAAGTGKIKAVKQHLKLGTNIKLVQEDVPGLDFGSPIAGQTPLGIAAWYGHMNVVQFLISEKANVNAMDEYGETALDYVTDPDRRIAPEQRARFIEIADLLRKHGGKRGKELKAAGN